MQNYVCIAVVEVAVMGLGPGLHGELLYPPYLRTGNLTSFVPRDLLVPRMLPDLLFKLKRKPFERLCRSRWVLGG